MARDNFGPTNVFEAAVKVDRAPAAMNGFAGTISRDLHKLRAAIAELNAAAAADPTKPAGRHAKPRTLFRKAKINDQRGYRALGILRKSGEYDGA